MGCLKSRKVPKEINTLNKIEDYLKKEDKYFADLLEDCEAEESLQDYSCLAEKYEISVHLNMLQDLIFYLRKDDDVDNDKQKQQKILDEILEILEIYEEAKKEKFKIAEVNKNFQDKVDYIVIIEKKQED